MIEEVFATGDSLMHRLDPRVRILAALVYSVPVALVSRPIPMILALALSILITALARLQVKALFKRLIIVNSIMGVSTSLKLHGAAMSSPYWLFRP